MVTIKCPDDREGLKPFIMMMSRQKLLGYITLVKSMLLTRPSSLSNNVQSPKKSPDMIFRRQFFILLIVLKYPFFYKRAFPVRSCLAGLAHFQYKHLLRSTVFNYLSFRGLQKKCPKVFPRNLSNRTSCQFQI